MFKLRMLMQLKNNNCEVALDEASAKLINVKALCVINYQLTIFKSIINVVLISSYTIFQKVGSLFTISHLHLLAR